MNHTPQKQNPWNPFITTTRDLNRTKELAEKNPIITGVLSFLFFPAGLIYLNRGINALKLLGYAFVLSFVTPTQATGGLAAIAITTEQVITVNKARTRQNNNPQYPSDSSFDNQTSSTNPVKVDQKAVAQLKELKRQYEANEISEEEFQAKKQEILKSL